MVCDPVSSPTCEGAASSSCCHTPPDPSATRHEDRPQRRVNSRP
jgi:hypothetical protein